MSPSFDDESSTSFPIRQILLAIVAYYGFVTYQFFRVRFFIDYYAPIGFELSPEEMRMAIFSYFNIDPSASILDQWLMYLVSQPGGYWQQSTFGEFVKFMLDLTLLWVGFIAAVAIVAGLIADWTHPRLGINGLRLDDHLWRVCRHVPRCFRRATCRPEVSSRVCWSKRIHRTLSYTAVAAH